MSSLDCPICGEGMPIQSIGSHLHYEHGLPYHSTPGEPWYCVCGVCFETARERAEHFRQKGRECVLVAMIGAGDGR